MPSAYPSWEAAARRVEILRRSGIWPGIIHQPDGRYRLTFDPDLEIPGG